MGQYYKPIILKDDKKTIVGWAYSHEYGCGLKLMEHSYIDNPLVNVVENYLKENGGARVVWAGDYADAEPVKIPKEEAKKLWQTMVANGTTETSFAEFWAKSTEVYKKDEHGELVGECLYSLADSAENENGKVIRRAKPKIKASCERNNFRYLINDSKKLYIDLWTIPCVDGYRVHPLPILTAEGNGRGGGDYSGLNMNLVGSWARDFIRMQEHDWDFLKDLENHGYKKFEPNFMETYSLTCQFRDTVKYIKEAMESQIENKEHFLKDIMEEFAELKDVLPQVRKKKVAKEEATSNA